MPSDVRGAMSVASHVSVTLHASPKSTSTSDVGSLNVLNTRLSGLTSRCTIPFECTYARPLESP